MGAEQGASTAAAGNHGACGRARISSSDARSCIGRTLEGCAVSRHGSGALPRPRQGENSGKRRDVCESPAHGSGSGNEWSLPLGPENSPVDVGPKLLAQDRAIGNSLDSGAALGWNSLQAPLVNDLMPFDAKGRGQLRDPAGSGDGTVQVSSGGVVHHSIVDSFAISESKSIYRFA